MPGMPWEVGGVTPSGGSAVSGTVPPTGSSRPLPPEFTGQDDTEEKVLPKTAEELEAERDLERIRLRLEAQMRAMYGDTPHFPGLGGTTGPAPRRRRGHHNDDGTFTPAPVEAETTLPKGSTWEQHELAWKFFEADNTNAQRTVSSASITFQEIPWPPRKTRRGTPVGAKEMLQGLAKLLAADEGETTSDQQPPPQFLKAAFRLLSLRWHPDKFRHTWAARIKPEVLDEVLAQVLKVSQEINSAYQQLR